MPLYGEWDWYMTKAGWKAKFKKWFPSHKDMTEKQLKRQRQGYYLMEGVWLFSLLLFAVLLAVNPYSVNSAFSLAVLALTVSGVAISAGMFAQYRVMEVEVNFELRLRELLENKP